MYLIKSNDNDQIGRISRRFTQSNKSMNSDDTIADLLMSFQKNHQSDRVNQMKVEKIDFTY